MTENVTPSARSHVNPKGLHGGYCSKRSCGGVAHGSGTSPPCATV